MAPSSRGSQPSTGKGTPSRGAGDGALREGETTSTRRCSSFAVLASDRRVSSPVSRPSAIAATPSSTSAPSTRRSRSPQPSERCIAANTRPPSSSASASEVAAPAANATSSRVVPTLAPLSAAAVRIRPRIGPAQGAHSRPVATPRPSAAQAESPASARMDRRPPSATNGRASQSEKRGSNSASPTSASTAIAIQRPQVLSCTTQCPPTAASVATAAKVSAMPMSIGRPLRANGRSARANTNGSTGRMHGLTMVSTPPR